MNATRFMLAFAAALSCSAVLGQTATEGERPVRPESASNAAIGGWCDALTGAKKDECLRDERRRQGEKAKEGQSARGSCEALAGLERERCLRQRGSIEIETATRDAASTGASRSDH